MTTPTSRLPWAAFIARWILGLMFFMAGVWRVFQLGPVEHARRFFVEPYAETILPAPLLWATGFAVPWVELIGGALLLVGLWRTRALIVLGMLLVVIVFGHTLVEPIYSFSQHVMPRLILLLFLLAIPADADRWALDLGRRTTGS